MGYLIVAFVTTIKDLGIIVKRSVSDLVREEEKSKNQHYDFAKSKIVIFFKIVILFL